MVLIGSYDLGELGIRPFTKVDHAITEGAMAAYEKEANIVLPIQYRTFLLACNGGTPAENGFAFGSRKLWIPEFYFVDSFGLVGSQKAHPFSISFARAKLENYVPNACLIIGAVVRDDLLVINLNSGEICIVFWEVVMESDSPPSSDTAVVLAGSFVELLAMLRRW